MATTTLPKRLYKKFLYSVIFKALSTLSGQAVIHINRNYHRIGEQLRYVWSIPLQKILLFIRLQRIPKVEETSKTKNNLTKTDSYWSKHTIAKILFSKKDSLDYLHTMSQGRPCKADYCGLYNKHRGEVILDYGCGPGNDALGWSLHANPEQVICMDVSKRALEFARRRLALHGVAKKLPRFIHISDAQTHIPLEDEAVDYIHCLGVLHHVSQPVEILKEFRRVLKPQGKACVMVYNANSVWIHLYFGYQVQILQGHLPQKTAHEAWHSMADMGAPIANCYNVKEWTKICTQAGFSCDYQGGYFMPTELNVWKQFHKKAQKDSRYPKAYKEFLEQVQENDAGMPCLEGKTIGHGSVYHLYKDHDNRL